jgi:nucleotide-binding universal stress UspA family protein
MQSPTKILVPVDFSESSRAALELAAALGSRLGAAVDVLHVWPVPQPGASDREMLRDFAVSEPGHQIVEWLASFEQRDAVEAHVRVAVGSRSAVPEAIVETVTSGAYDLIVMGTHGRQGLSLLWRSSISDEVAKRAPCPVLMVRADDGAPHPGGRGCPPRWPGELDPDPPSIVTLPS